MSGRWFGGWLVNDYDKTRKSDILQIAIINIFEDMQQDTLMHFTIIHLDHPLLVMRTELASLITLCLYIDFK